MTTHSQDILYAPGMCRNGVSTNEAKFNLLGRECLITSAGEKGVRELRSQSICWPLNHFCVQNMPCVKNELLSRAFKVFFLNEIKNEYQFEMSAAGYNYTQHVKFIPSMLSLYYIYFLKICSLECFKINPLFLLKLKKKLQLSLQCIYL